MDRVYKSYFEKYLGLATVAITCLATFSASDTNGLIALAVSVGLMGTYWSIYRDQ
jgi:hypothetical protein